MQRTIRSKASLLEIPSALRWRKVVDRIMAGVVILCLGMGIFALLSILSYVILRGAPALNLAFFTQRPLPYGEPGGGVAPAILGTLTMLAVGAAFGLPVGLGAAIYLSEYGSSRYASVIRFVIDLLAGVPSIAIGVFVWAILVRRVTGQYSGLAGGVALGIIMVPIVARTAEEILRLVPSTLREAALALGVPHWKMVLRVVLPTALGGLVTAVVLGLARAGGETAPLLLTALGNQFFNFNLFHPTAALPIQIYTYAVGPYEDWHTKAWGGSLVLIIVIGGLNLLTRLAVSRRRM